MTDLTREGLVELATKVEQAAAGDADLDHAIGAAMHAEGWHAADCIANFTRSMDAAMTLIPKGRWYWSVKNYPNAHSAADIGGIYIATGATPVLALCAAALTARARAMEAGRG